MGDTTQKRKISNGLSGIFTVNSPHNINIKPNPFTYVKDNLKIWQLGIF